jgi:hypothetical protein
VALLPSVRRSLIIGILADDNRKTIDDKNLDDSDGELTEKRGRGVDWMKVTRSGKSTS